MVLNVSAPNGRDRSDDGAACDRTVARGAGRRGWTTLATPAILAATTAFLTSTPVGPARADEASDPDAIASAEAMPSTTIRLSPIQITATRIPQPLGTTAAAVTVIEDAELQRLQPKSFPELLRGRSGVGVFDSGGYGKVANVQLRGTNTTHTLLLVDGVRLGSATAGAPAWHLLPVSMIERVEIVRGPRSSLYGSDALGGVIQVFTREGEAGPPRARALVGIGDSGTREFGASLGGGSAGTRYALAAHRFRTDGIDVLDGVGDTAPDGHEQTAWSTRVSHTSSDRGEWFGQALLNEGRSEFDSDEFDSVTFARIGAYTPAYNDFRQATLRLGWRGEPSDRWETEWALAQSRDELYSFEGGRQGNRESRFDTRRYQFEWRNTIRLDSDRLWLTGIDAGQDRVSSSERFLEDSRYTVGVYSVLEANWRGQDLSLGLRHDNDEQFGGQTTGQIGWGVQVSDAWRLRASAGTAFNAPSFNDLYYPNSSSYRSNPDLEPEESVGVEWGARFETPSSFLDLTLFQQRVRNLIMNVADAQWVFQPQNLRSAQLRGLEIEGGHQAAGWRSGWAVTLLDAEDRGTGNALRRRPPVSARIDLDRDLQRWTLGLSAVGQARSFEDAANTDRLSGFVTLDLRGSYTLHRNWQLAFSIRNLLDRDYVVSRQFGTDYNQPGRTGFVTLRYRQR